MSEVACVAILGATGYGAGELLRLLAGHPRARVVSLVGRSHVGEPIDAVHPHLRGFYDLRISPEPDLTALRDAPAAVVFSALPSGVSGRAVAELLERAGDARLRVIDLSGDLRLRDPQMHRRFYPETPELSQLREQAVYGLPELNAERIARARIVANPGCLAAAVILALAPLAKPGLDGPVAIDACTGSSGSGRSLKETTHHPTRHGELWAYRPLAHQHEPEIVQAVRDATGVEAAMSFVPHSMDAARGIAVTLHATLREPANPDRLRTHYEAFYAQAPFVRIREAPPRLQHVVGSNFCDIGLTARGRQVVVLAAIDNLVKGMAGTAIQNMNLMCGFEQTQGLWFPAPRLT